MKLATLKSAKVELNLGKEKCGLPMSILAIIEALTDDNSLGLPRGLTKDYMNCDGLGKKLLKNEWDKYIWSFPMLVCICIATILLPLICVAWCIWQFRRKRRRRFERAPIPMIRYILSSVLFVLKIIFCFFLWFTYTSYQKHPDEHNADPETAYKQLDTFYERTLYIIDHVFTDNINIMERYMTDLAEDMRSSINASAPQILKTTKNGMLNRINSESAWYVPILKEMNEDMEELLIDALQLMDVTRLINRNTTMFLEMGNMSDPKYAFLINNEIEANYHKMTTLLNIEKFISNINEIFIMSVGLSKLRATFAEGIDELHHYYVFYLENLWKEKVKGMNNSYKAMVESVHELRSNGNEMVMIRLPKDVYSYQLLFITIATLICILCWLQIIYAIYHSISMNFKKKKYLLVGIIVLVCMSAIILCLIASHSLFVGTSFYNFRQSTYKDDNPCGQDIKSYCDTYNKIQSTQDNGLLIDEVEEMRNILNLKNEHIFEKIRAALPTPASISNILQLSAYTSFMADIFNAGAMFNVVKQELNMENWYEAYEQLNTHISIKDANNTNNIENEYYENMLECNLNMMKIGFFENLIQKEIMNRVKRLSKNAEMLAASLPIKDMNTIMNKSLEEMRLLHDYIELELRDILSNKTDEILHNYLAEMYVYNNHIDLIPNCQQFKLPGVSMPRNLYECIEKCLHGFWIGAFALLLLLFPILIVCMVLNFLYDKYPYSSQGGTNTSTPRSSGGSSRSSSATASPPSNASPDEDADDADYAGGDSPSEEGEGDLRFRYAPRAKRSHVTFNAAEPETKTKKKKMTKKKRIPGDNLTNKRRSSTAKIRDLINSVIKSASNEPPEDEPEESTSSKSSTNPSPSLSLSSEELSETEVA